MNRYIEDGGPEGMYPMDVDYPNEADNLDELIEQAERGSDVLNYPISWHLTKDDEYGSSDKFQIVFLMPRKYGKTWSIETSDFDPDRAVEWVKDFTYRAATEWYGWNE